MGLNERIYFGSISKKYVFHLLVTFSYFSMFIFNSFLYNLDTEQFQNGNIRNSFFLLIVY